MQRLAFKMFLNQGQRDEYKRRHDEIWPELRALLRRAGVRNYSIHLDSQTDTLFAYLERSENHDMDGLPNDAIMRRWWDHMKEIMATEPDGSPVTALLEEVFFLE